MSRYNDDLKLKLAWQTAYEQRTCPPAELLHAETVDDNLRRHLTYCEACRESRTMGQEEKTAWQGLFKKMSGAATPKSYAAIQEGQVWTLKKSLGRWQEDGRYLSPPVVLLIGKQDAFLWKVVQLFGDKRLAGDGDVPLDDRFGFAEGWNSYSLDADRFEKLLGMVTPNHLQQVLSASNTTHNPVPEGSILSFFRSFEINVGDSVAVSSARETEPAQSRELIPGLKLLVAGAKEYVLDIAADTLAVLRGTFKPALVVRGGPAKSSAPRLTDEQKQLIVSQCPAVPLDVKISGSHVLITLKWLIETPVEQFAVQILMDETSLSDVGVSCSNSGLVTVSSSDKLIPEFGNHEPQDIKLTVSDGLISISLVRREKGL